MLWRGWSMRGLVGRLVDSNGCGGLLGWFVNQSRVYMHRGGGGGGNTSALALLMCAVPIK